MSSSIATSLCRTCRNLNLILDSFIQTGWRYPTTLQYKTVLDYIDHSTEEVIARHYVIGEHIEDDKDYTDVELGTRLKAPPFIPEFDIDDGLLLNVPPSKRRTLGRLSEVLARASGCCLCRLISEQVAPHCREQAGATETRSCTNEEICKISLDYDGQGSGFLTRDLMIQDESLAFGRYNCEITVGKSIKIVLYPLPAEPGITWFGGRPYKSQIDLSLIKNWVDACTRTHERCGPQSWHSQIRPISLLRFIDVQDMCLVDAPGESQFIALSYVWGAVPIFKSTLQNKTKLYSKNGLSQFMPEVPSTIQDAMRVVRDLGFRYLWTDAICIIQDDREEKAQLIAEMDVVYARATLTIVAAEGTTANSSLPGILPNSRKASQVFTYSPSMKFLVAATPLPDVLLACPWSKRGWTYQEGLLGARLLIFTNSAVHFACSSTCWSEDLHNISETTPPPWKFASGSQYNFLSTLNEDNNTATDDLEVDPLADLWQTTMMELSDRVLSYEEDILFAGAGMFGLLESLFGVRSLWGIPESRMEDFLFWSPTNSGTLRRRQGRFPSWSWSGWVGGVGMTGGWAEEKPPAISDPIEWMKLKEPGTDPLMLDRHGRGKQTISIGEQGKPRRDVQNDWFFLYFKSCVYRLQISPHTSPPEWAKELLPYAWSQVPEDGEELQGVYCITCPESPKRVIGSMVIDSLDSIMDKDVLDAHFVLISSEPQALDVGEFAGQVFHNVLALSFNGTFYQRIGHGRILNDFVVMNPVEKQEITLG